jgi:hypothetical protein
MVADPQFRLPTPHTGIAAILAEARRAREAGSRSEAAALLERALAIDADFEAALLALWNARPVSDTPGAMA